MTYVNKFVAAIKVGKGFLREIDKEIVKIPFGSYYSIYVKNMNSRKAKVHITIDDKYIGGDLILDKNESATLERFIDGSLDKGPRFKFIEKTDKVAESRGGDQPIDGIIRLEYTFEREIIPQPVVKKYFMPPITYYEPIWPTMPTMPTYIWTTNGLINTTNTTTSSTSGIIGGIDNTKFKSFATTGTSTAFTCNSTPTSVNLNSVSTTDEGITVRGKESDQTFQYGWLKELEDKSEVIIFNLKGYKEDGNTHQPIKIVKPFTVNDKLVCENCNKTNKSNHKFCCYCGYKLNK